MSWCRWRSCRQIRRCRSSTRNAWSCRSCHKHGFAAIDELARGLGVRLAFHGHHHRDIAYPHDPQLGFRAISVGLAGITALDGSIVHPGVYDSQAQ